MKSYSLQDVNVSAVRNQFTQQNGNPLNDPNRIYFVTSIRGTNWTMNVKNNGNQYTRSGSTDMQFYVPVVANVIVFTGITEVSGFYIELTNL